MIAEASLGGRQSEADQVTPFGDQATVEVLQSGS
jgi:hypothetical protein